MEKAKELADYGFGVIELCGAFGKDVALQMYEAVNHRLTVGYVINPEEQIEALEHKKKKK